MVVAIDAVGIRMGGGARLLLDFLEWLPRVRPEWEWVVYLLPRRCREFDDPPPWNGVEIETVPIGDSCLGRMWWLYGGLRPRLARAGADVLLAFANVASPRCPVPQVVYVHQLLAFRSSPMRPPIGFREVRLQFLRALILRGALRSASVIVQTQDMRHRLEAAAPGLTGRVHVIPGCVSSAGRVEEIRPEKRRLIESARPPRLAYVAHAGEHKNHLTLIRALPKIAENYVNATLMLTIDPEGGNDWLDQGYVRRVRQLAQELGVNSHIVWLGMLTQAEVKYLLQQATVAIFPSLDESFGLPLAEAIVEGCPLVASDLPFARDIAGGAAVYFDPLDPDSIARCVTSLIGSQRQIQHIKMEASKRRERFQPRSVAEQIAAALETARGLEHLEHDSQLRGTIACPSHPQSSPSAQRPDATRETIPT
jgi:glycosyltransferase involved in cell wall biosynthesis